MTHRHPRIAGVRHQQADKERVMAIDFAKDSQELLSKQVSVTDQLVQLLKQEYNILKSIEVGELVELAQHKTTLVNELESLNQDWQQLLRHARVPIDLDSISNSLEKVDPRNELGLLDQWSALADLARECQKQNTINGSVILLRQQAATYSLDILTGQNSANETYGPKGTSHQSGKGGHSLGKV